MLDNLDCQVEYSAVSCRINTVKFLQDYQNW